MSDGSKPAEPRGRFARRPYLLPLVAVLVAAAVSRLAWLDLMEFKGDEAAACRLALHVLGYSEPGVGRFFPTAGLVSSIGIPNPPLFVYLMAVPLAIVPSAVGAAAAIAAANVVAIWLTFVVGSRCWSRFVGVAAAALMALSPWSIVFSRKIWAQDMLPLCTTLFALELHALLVKKAPRAGFWLIVIATAGTQLHFSAWILFGVAFLAFFIARRWISWRWVAGGVAVAVISYLPFLIFHAASILDALSRPHGSHIAPNLLTRFERSVGFMIDLTGGGGMGFLLGSSSLLATVLSVALGVAATVGLVAYARSRSRDSHRLGVVYAVWFVLPLLTLTALPVRPYIHYFIVVLPLPYFGIAYLLELSSRKQRAVRIGAVVAIVCCYAVVDGQFFRTILRHGGAPAEYGIAYKYKREAVTYMLRHSTGRDLKIGFDLHLRRVRPLEPYRVLAWSASLGTPAAPSRRRGARGFVLVSRFERPPPLLGNSSATPRYRRKTYGPLTVVAIP